MLTKTQFTTLTTMLTYCRPHGCPTERAFLTRYLAPLPGIVEDRYGNWHCTIGESSVLWSCHTDTVHRTGGYQTLAIDRIAGTIALSKRSQRTSQCLGADDTVGVFLMREMILAGVPGRYIFHYGEESGCLGSRDLAEHTPEVLASVTHAIALDRAGIHDIVTHQQGSRCCSPSFVDSLANLFTLPYSGAHGVYTDTAEYTRLVPECTNLSVGYYHQHTPREYVDYRHVGRLLTALCALDTTQLACDRDPHVEDVLERWGTFTSKRFDRTPWEDWCLYCDAPIVASTTDDDGTADVCQCRQDDTAHDGLTSDERAFLAYLKGL